MFAKLINETTIEESEKPQYELQDTENSSYTLIKTDEV